MTRKITMKDSTEILSAWEHYCRGIAVRMAGVIDIEILAQEARVKVWMLAAKYEGDDLAQQIYVGVPNHLLDMIRKEGREMRDWRKTRDIDSVYHDSVEDCTYLRARDSVLDFNAEIEDTTIFREGVARLLAMANEDERALLDMLVNGSDALRDELVARKRPDHRIGAALIGRVLDWTERRAEEARQGLQRKALIAFS